MHINDISLYESLCHNAHPPLQTQLYDGWLLRYADGYTNRANSILPLYPSTLPLEEKLTACESRYNAQNLPCVYKLTHAWDDVDAALDGRGYTVVTPTYNMVADLSTANLSATCPRAQLEFSTIPTDAWYNAYFGINGYTDPHKMQIARRIIANIHNAALYVLLSLDGVVIGCGSCVIENGYASLQNISIDAAYRRNGYGRALCAGLLKQAQSYGATHGYLQVMQSNTGAIQLYEKLGYSITYEYWYRVQQTCDMQCSTHC